MTRFARILAIIPATAALSSPAHAETPEMSAPFSLGAPVLGSRCIAQEGPTLARGPDGLVLVWLERQLGDSTHVYAMALDEDGRPRGTPSLLSDRAVTLSPPAIAWDGDRFVAVWLELGAARAAVLDSNAHVTSVFGVLDDRRLTAPGLVGRRLAISANNRRTLVVMQRAGDIVGRLLAFNGDPLEDRALQIGTGTAHFLAGDGRDFFVAFATTTGVGGRRIDASGALGPVLTATIARAAAPAIAHDGEAYRAVWSARSDPNVIYGVRFLPDASSWAPIEVARGESGQVFQGVVLSESGASLGFVIREQVNDHWNVFTAALDRALVPGERVRVTDTADRAVDVNLSEGTGSLLAVWSMSTIRSNAESEIRGAVISGSSVAGEVVPAGGVACRLHPAVTRHGSGHLVSWLDGRRGGLRHFAARVGADNAVLDDPVVEVVELDNVRSRSIAAPLGDGSVVFFVVSDGDTYNLRFARVDGGGRSLDAMGTSISTGPIGGGGFSHLSPAIAAATSASGDQTLVTWRGWLGLDDAILAARITQDGMMPGAVFAVSTDVVNSNVSGLTSEPAVAWDGEAFRVVWHDARVSLARPELWSARVAPDASVSGEQRLGEGHGGGALALAGGIGGLLLLESVHNPEPAVWALPIAPADEPFVVTTDQIDRRAAVAPVDSGYLIAWTSGGIARARLVGPEGPRGDPLLIADDARYQEVALAPGPRDSEALVVMERHELNAAPGGRVGTIDARRIDFDPDALEPEPQDPAPGGLEEENCDCRNTGGDDASLVHLIGVLALWFISDKRPRRISKK